MNDRLWNRFEQTGSIRAYLAWRDSLYQGERSGDEGVQSAGYYLTGGSDGRQGQETGYAHPRERKNSRTGEGRPFA